MKILLIVSSCVALIGCARPDEPESCRRNVVGFQLNASDAVVEKQAALATCPSDWRKASYCHLFYNGDGITYTLTLSEHGLSEDGIDVSSGILTSDGRYIPSTIPADCLANLTSCQRRLGKLDESIKLSDAMYNYVAPIATAAREMLAQCEKDSAE